MDDAIEDTMMGRTPKKALIIDGPVSSKEQMLFWVKL